MSETFLLNGVTWEACAGQRQRRGRVTLAVQTGRVLRTADHNKPTVMGFNALTKRVETVLRKVLQPAVLQLHRSVICNGLWLPKRFEFGTLEFWGYQAQQDILDAMATKVREEVYEMEDARCLAVLEEACQAI